MQDNKMPLLSVIIPVYNGEAYLTETISYIQKSKYYNLEILLIDDGSTDESYNIIQVLMQKDKRIRCFRQENQGIVAARNRGIEKASGKYICFCDQDDLTNVKMYSELLDKIMAAQADMGICSTGRLINGEISVYEVVEDGVYKQDSVLEYVLYPILFQGYQYSFIKGKNYIYGTVWKCIFAADFIRKNDLKFVSFVNFEDDWIFVTKALTCAGKVVSRSIEGYIWRINYSSESHGKVYIQDLLNRIKRLDSYVFEYLEKRISDKYILECFKDVFISQHYLEICDNIINSSKRLRDEDKKQFYRYLYDTDYKQRLICCKYIKSGIVRKKIFYFLLNRGQINIAQRVNLVLKYIEKVSYESVFLSKIERNLKRITG